MFKLLGAIIISTLMLGGCGTNSESADKVYTDSYGNEISEKEVNLVQQSLDIKDFWLDAFKSFNGYIDKYNNIMTESGVETKELKEYAEKLKIKNDELSSQLMMEIYTGEEVSIKAKNLGENAMYLLYGVSDVIDIAIERETMTVYDLQDIQKKMRSTVEYTYPDYESAIELIEWVK